LLPEIINFNASGGAWRDRAKPETLKQRPRNTGVASRVARGSNLTFRATRFFTMHQLIKHLNGS